MVHAVVFNNSQPYFSTFNEMHERHEIQNTFAVSIDLILIYKYYKFLL